MRRAVALVGFLLVGCGGDGGTEPEPGPTYELADLTGTWLGDSDCRIGRYRFVFPAPADGALAVAGQSWMSQTNGAGVCVEGATPGTVTANVSSVSGSVTVAWPATASTRFVWRSRFLSASRLATGRFRDETKPVSYITLPDEFGMAKQ